MTKKQIIEMIQATTSETFQKSMKYSREASTEQDPAKRSILGREENFNTRLLVVLQEFIDRIDGC